jgi:epsilon-lactone hydrolase
VWQTTLKRLLRIVLRLFVKPVLHPRAPVRLQRRWSAAVSAVDRPPRGVDEERVELGGVATLLSRSAAGAPADRPALLWAHGGDFMIGGRSSHRGLCGHLAEASAADVYLPEYRLAPEHPAPAPYDDLFAAYTALLERGHRPERVAIGGDSAGGALAVATALAAVDMDVARPAAMVLISPFLDLELSGTTIATKARIDPFMNRAWLEQGALAHAGTLPRGDARINFLFADLGGLPPTLVQVGEDEILLDDAVRFADRAWAAGVEVELQRFPGLWHDFQLHAALLEVSARAVGDIGAFLRRRWEARA